MTRFRRGNITAAKITPLEVKEIRRRYDKGESQRSLCQAFGLSIGQIGRVVRREVWLKVEEAEGLSNSETLERASTEPSNAEIEASLKRMQKLLGGEEPGFVPPAPPDILDKLTAEVKATLVDEEKLSSELDEFLK